MVTAAYMLFRSQNGLFEETMPKLYKRPSTPISRLHPIQRCEHTVENSLLVCVGAIRLPPWPRPQESAHEFHACIENLSEEP